MNKYTLLKANQKQSPDNGMKEVLEVLLTKSVNAKIAFANNSGALLSRHRFALMMTQVIEPNY